MRHRKKGKILDRKKGPREMMLKNLASSIIIYEKVKTTQAKAKAVKPLLEKIITIAKESAPNMRQLEKVLPQKMAIKKTLEVLKDRFRERKGGYTRIINLGSRQGDRAKIVRIELV